MKWLLAMLISCSSGPSDPHPEIVVQKVDLIEVNHYFDDRGQKVFDQIIFYDWSIDQMRFNVRGYRLVKQPSQYPIHSALKRFDSIWIDGDRFQNVYAPNVRETWTQFDPELAERNYWPKSIRPDLPADTPPLRGSQR